MVHADRLLLYKFCFFAPTGQRELHLWHLWGQEVDIHSTIPQAVKGDASWAAENLAYGVDKLPLCECEAKRAELRPTSAGRASAEGLREAFIRPTDTLLST